MSGELLFDVMNCDGFKKPAMKLLLIALADRADEAGICWPSRSDLVLRTGLSLSSLTRTARALESDGWLQRKQRRDASTVYRLNVVKIGRCAAQCKADRRLRRAGEEWEPFPEETAQAVENDGEGQSEPGSGQTEPGSGHGDRLTSQEPLKNLAREARAPKPRRSPRSGGASSAPKAGPKAPTVDPARLTAFERASVASDRSVMIDGRVIRSGSREMDALRQACAGAVQ